MNTAPARDHFFGICGVGVVLILAVALGVPALNGGVNPSQAATPAVQTATTQARLRANVESAMRPVVQLLQPFTAAAFGG